MKTVYLLALAFVLPFVSFAQPVALPARAQAQAIDRGPHHAVWHWTIEELWPDGSKQPQEHYVVELATGLNYLNNGQWIPSKEEIELFQDGAVARQGQFQAIFSPNLNVAGAVDLVTPSGTRFQSRIMGLSYFDTASGKSALIAETRDSQGQVLPPNQVFYLDAFTDVQADVRYTYRLGSFEQDVILRENPPSPSAFGLSDATSHLEVWTEFFDPPAVTKQDVPLRVEEDLQRRSQMVAPDLVDHRLDFGDAQIGSGKALASGDEAGEQGVLVAKDWLVLNGQNGKPRTFLVESVEYPVLRPWLQDLPNAQAALKANNPAVEGLARRQVKSRPQLLAITATPRTAKDALKQDKTQVAKVAISPQLSSLKRRPGVVLDYIEYNSSQTNQSFVAENTYLITGTVNLYGTNIIQGGTVIKFYKSVNATLDIKGTLIADTGLYRPAVLTANDDTTVGEDISVGALSGSYATTAINFDYVTSAKLASLQNIRIMYALTGVRFNGGSGHELRHVQFVNCGTAVKGDSSQYAMRNVLGWNLTNALTGSSSTGVWEHATLDGVTNLVSAITGRFTNCLLTAVVNTNGLAGQGNVALSSASGVYAVAGSGSHYLATGSPYRDVGTTGINPTLTNEFKARTTYPPLVLGNVIADTTLYPQASRDSSQPDLGFHYAPLDYFASGVGVGSNVTLSIGTGAAVGMDFSSSSWGFILTNARLVSIGDAIHSNYLGRAHMAQEKSGGNPGTRACFYDGASSASSRDCALRLRFTEFSQLMNDGYILFVGTRFGALEWTHSRIYNPSLVIDTSGSGTLVCGMTNTLWEHGFVQIGMGTTSGSGVTVHLRNNLAKNIGSWYFLKGSNTWTIHDNLFDTVGVLTNNGDFVENSYNAYYLTATNGLTGGISNVSLATLTYDIGPLGPYYLPTNSVLINRGGTNSTIAGLYHFTTAATNQVKETNSTVDIGLHWVAVDANNNPKDGDVDGVPDYLEDADGDGVVDSGETDWTNATDLGLRVQITNPKNNNPIP